MILKIFLVILVAISVTATTFDSFLVLEPPPNPRTCSLVTYGGRDAPCDNATKRCKLNYVCKQNKCTPGWIGSECQTNSDCAFSGINQLGVRCVTQLSPPRCVKPRYNGGNCQVDQQCFGGLCDKNQGICVGLKQGEPCDPAARVQCDKGLYCSKNQGVCVAQLDLGARCSDYLPDVDEDSMPEGSNWMVICPGGSKCMGPTGSKSCISYRSGKIDSPCSWNREGNDDCEFGLVCNVDTRKCQSTRQYPNYVCLGIQNVTSTQCSVMGQDCICPANGATNVPPTCKTTSNMMQCDYDSFRRKYRDCMVTNNCAYEKNFGLSVMVDALSRNTCMGRNCGQLARDYICCAFNGYSGDPQSWADLTPYTCPGVNPLTVFGVIILVLFLIIFTAVLIGGTFGGFAYYFYRMKNKPDPFQRLE